MASRGAEKTSKRIGSLVLFIDPHSNAVMLTAVYLLIYDDLSNAFTLPADDRPVGTWFPSRWLRDEARQTTPPGGHFTLFRPVAGISTRGRVAAVSGVYRWQQHQHAGEWRRDFSGNVERNPFRQTLDQFGDVRFLGWRRRQTIYCRLK